jgi:ABC-2 type transport system ATP-binding protein
MKDFQIDPKAPALEITNVHKTYKSGTEALKGMSFSVKQGEFFALLGPNGSGKSTLINIIGGPTRISEGEINVCGLNIEEDREKTKSLLGIVSQEIVADSFFTINESLILQSGYYGLRDNQKRIDEVLEKLNLIDKKHAKTRALSGGMKRRLMVAKALVHNPKVLILDEPTAGVDVELRHNLWEYMEKLNKEGLTILLTTHYLEEAENLCERTAIIHKGKLVKLDETKNLIKDKKLEDVFIELTYQSDNG